MWVVVDKSSDWLVGDTSCKRLHCTTHFNENQICMRPNQLKNMQLLFLVHCSMFHKLEYNQFLVWEWKKNSCPTCLVQQLALTSIPCSYGRSIQFGSCHMTTKKQGNTLILFGRRVQMIGSTEMDAPAWRERQYGSAIMIWKLLTLFWHSNGTRGGTEN